MRIECVEAFADASVRTLEAMLGDEFACGQPRLAAAEERPGGITVHVRFSGDHEGHVALNIDERTALRLYARATGEDHERLPGLGLDYFLELAGVICGGAVSRLNELGFDVSLQAPELPPAAGAGTDASEVCAIPVRSADGAIAVQVVLCTA
jgi:CheY-specific phosphatase CheX